MSAREGPVRPWASAFTWPVLKNTPQEKFLGQGNLCPLVPQNLSVWGAGHSCAEDEGHTQCACVRYGRKV